jgi:NAD(P)-dependent dehydrogenase (short-subunit alcohol dehydrogenase family)
MSTTQNQFLIGKTAVVTGGTRGIGRAISLSLARAGAKVFALYARDRATADSLAQEAIAEKLLIECVRGDLTKDESFNEITQYILTRSPQIHILVHSAASGVHRPASEITLKHLRWTFEINVFAFHHLVTALVDHMPPGSRILGITSSGGTRTIPFYTAVGSSKGALDALLRHYAAEFGSRGITVNGLCPGMVLTDAFEVFPDKERRLEATIKGTPTGKLATPEDVAVSALFLCRPEASQITGHILVIDGGKTLSS